MQIAWDAVPSTDIYKVSVFIDGNLHQLMVTTEKKQMIPAWW